MALTFTDANPDTIRRASGNWSNDGFKVGQIITISGSGSNDGTYTIDGVIPDVLTLSTGDSLRNEPLSPNRVITIQASGWKNIDQRDGSTKVVIPVDVNGDGHPDRTLRFVMGDSFSEFAVNTHYAYGLQISSQAVGLRNAAGATRLSGLDRNDTNVVSADIPMVVNQVDSNRMLIGLIQSMRVSIALR